MRSASEEAKHALAAAQVKPAIEQLDTELLALQCRHNETEISHNVLELLLVQVLGDRFMSTVPGLRAEVESLPQHGMLRLQNAGAILFDLPVT